MEKHRLIYRNLYRIFRIAFLLRFLSSYFYFTINRMIIMPIRIRTRTRPKNQNKMMEQSNYPIKNSPNNLESNNPIITQIWHTYHISIQLTTDQRIAIKSYNSDTNQPRILRMTSYTQSYLEHRVFLLYISHNQHKLFRTKIFIYSFTRTRSNSV